jgi:hypothetical protein
MKDHTISETEDRESIAFRVSVDVWAEVGRLVEFVGGTFEVGARMIKSYPKLQ